MDERNNAIRGLILYISSSLLLVWVDMFALDVIVLCLFYYLYKDRIKKDFKKLSISEAKRVIITYFVADFLICVLENIVSIMGFSDSANQNMLYELKSEMNPVLYILMLCVTGPLIEEITFRFCIFSLFRRKIFKYFFLPCYSVSHI